MLEHLPDLTSFLNEATQAWVEYEYNRKVHSEIGEAPSTRFLAGPEGDTAQPRTATRYASPSPAPITACSATAATARSSSNEGRRFQVPT